MSEGKAEALDLLINVLREHEKSLDKVVKELKTIVRRERIPELTIVECDSWEDFKKRSRDAKIATFNIIDGKNVVFTTVSGDVVCRFVLNIKKWLGKELGIPEVSIVE